MSGMASEALGIQSGPAELRRETMTNREGFHCANESVMVVSSTVVTVMKEDTQVDCANLSTEPMTQGSTPRSRSLCAVPPGPAPKLTPSSGHHGAQDPFAFFLDLHAFAKTGILFPGGTPRPMGSQHSKQHRKLGPLKRGHRRDPDR